MELRIIGVIVHNTRAHFQGQKIFPHASSFISTSKKSSFMINYNHELLLRMSIGTDRDKTAPDLEHHCISYEMQVPHTTRKTCSQVQM